MAGFKVEPNDNPKEREDRRGRVRVSNQRTWAVICPEGWAIDEYPTKRQAIEAAERMNARPDLWH